MVRAGPSPDPHTPLQLSWQSFIQASPWGIHPLRQKQIHMLPGEPPHKRLESLSELVRIGSDTEVPQKCLYCGALAEGLHPPAQTFVPQHLPSIIPLRTSLLWCLLLLPQPTHRCRANRTCPRATAGLGQEQTWKTVEGTQPGEEGWIPVAWEQLGAQVQCWVIRLPVAEMQCCLCPSQATWYDTTLDRCPGPDHQPCTQETDILQPASHISKA